MMLTKFIFMKLRFSALLLCLFFIFTTAAFGQKKKPAEKKLTGYYRTYQDFLDKKLVEQDELASYFHSVGKVTLVFKKGGEKEKIKCAEIWGFLFKGQLFRIDETYGQPAKVISAGKITYYENGWAHMEMIKSGTDKGEYAIGYYGYLSNDLNSKMTPLPIGLSDAKKKFKDFKASNLQHGALYDCMEDGKSLDVTRNCVAKYNNI